MFSKFIGIAHILAERYLFIGLIFIPVLAGISEHALATGEIPVAGAVYSIHGDDGRQRSNFEIVIGDGFSGKLPGTIDSIGVSGPSGTFALTKEDFHYNPQWRSFWVSIPGQPLTGKYVFKVTSGGLSGIATDTQRVSRIIPRPDSRQFRPGPNETNACLMTTFSWPLITSDIPLYYQLEMNNKHRTVYRTQYVRDMNSVRVPKDKFEPGVEYRWRVRVSDGPDWIKLDNRSQSRWIQFIPPLMTNSCAYAYSAPRKMDDGWGVSDLHSEGIDENILKALMRKILNEDIKNIQGLLIVKNGKLVLDEYFGGYAPNRRHPLASVTKSITSILVGIAIDQKAIPGVNGRIYGLLPSYKDLAWDEAHRRIRLKHVLSMTAGLEWSDWQFPEGDMRDSTTAMVRSDDWIRFTLSRKAVEAPGKVFVYNNGLTLTIGEIIRETTGLGADKFADQFLFSPMGITDYRWRKARNGIVDTAGGLELRPRDMAKVGSMMLNAGVWKTRTIVPPRWILESTNAYRRGHFLFGSGYGYQWWRGKAFIGRRKIDLFYAAGKGGQYIFICPELDLIAVVTSEVRENPLGEYRPQMIMADYIIPSALPHVRSGPVAEFNIMDKEKYVGDYFCPKYRMRVRILQDSSQLFYLDPENRKGKLHFVSAKQCVAYTEMFGNVRANFFKDENEDVRYFILQVGFGFWRFDRVQ